MKVSIFLCECGGNISDRINLKKLSTKLQEDVNLDVHIHPFLCSPKGQVALVQKLKKGTKVLIGACSPHLHGETFKTLLAEIGIHTFQIVAIREEAAWTDGNTPEEKALRLIKGALKALKGMVPPQIQESLIVPNLMVIGGGIAGIVAAIKAAQEGIPVYLIEKEPFVGGKAVFLDRLYPRFECASCVISPKLSTLLHEKRVQIITQARIVKITGLPGKYEVELEIRPRYVDLQKCNGCGKCLEACPLNPPAIAFHNPHPVPRVPVINPFACLRLKGQTCRRCQRACPQKAINFKATFQRTNLQVGGFIVATGFRPYPVEKISFYGYQRLPGVWTLFDLEKKFTFGEELLGINDRPPQRVAIVHCAGSRDRRHLPYCSEICCGLALKAALRIKEVLGAEVYNFYLDLRLKGKEGEELYDRVREAGVKFIRGRVAEISDVPFNRKDKGRLLVLAEDTLLSKKVKLAVDMVVLVPGFIPEFGSREIGNLLGLCTDSLGFFEARESKTSPVETVRKAVWLAGATSGPKDISESVISAEAAALEAISFLKKGKHLFETDLVTWQKERCGRCYLCVETCPYQAIRPIGDQIKIHSEFCTACGLCVTACPSRALEFRPLGIEAFKGQVEEILA
ncbi:CoB--CoM heterodisulfide reductase iron-sulfur subunit A family protein [Thermosulfurimonas dismutans]|uniref:CoB--CoM heterodisulfide reductase subunit A n=1 Tax=Thermosulfurimonas dismutans TaxID=999894 RepID=A0A179D4M2_9BACT|nr:CoB--CoM heterodisulfide reductase iron-sulfur subunit A family protein [Thermosulfurimonas dismutans]OAQ20986.1 CoB--CoM heterodisulfide reductase subunit A [Thermosulfurimonas dismutans]